MADPRWTRLDSVMVQIVPPLANALDGGTFLDSLVSHGCVTHHQGDKIRRLFRESPEDAARELLSILRRTPSFDSFCTVLQRENQKALHDLIASTDVAQDMCTAAENQFASSDEAHEAFHHLVKVKGISVNAVDDERTNNTPLHYACNKGTIFGVKWLVKNNAAINRANRVGKTPFMEACKSSIDRLLKVRYLGKKGANCQAKDYHGKTALFYATKNSKHTDDVKEVLRYLVVEKDINISAVEKRGRTPLLHACASSSPSFVVIQQLIRLRADITVEDMSKKNALRLAESNGSTDKIIIDLLSKKTVDVTCEDEKAKTRHHLAREDDCITADVAQHMCFAAENQFASFEDAHEVFHCLVNEKEMSVNATEEMIENTPLHHACKKGSFFGVKWLVEHNAVVNKINGFGQTPFMLACKSSIDRSLKARYLGQKGADCRANDHIGQTALFYATKDSKSEGDVEDVLRYLVIEKGLTINSVEKNGRTPLLHACDSYSPSLVVIQQIIELGADLSVRDQRKQNALHVAAKNYEMSKPLIDLLIENGVDVMCEDEKGKMPYQLARDGEIRMVLRQRYETARFSVLQRVKVRPNMIKVCVIGNEMAGKTTFINSLLNLILPPIDPEDRTPGIEIRNCIIPGVGKGTTWDFGAQRTFRSAYGLFFGPANTIFVLVIRFQKKQDMKFQFDVLFKIACYWCAFVKASLRTPSSRRLRLFVIFNLIDCEEETGIEVSSQLKRIAEALQKEFEDAFEVAHVIEMDCRKRTSVRMSDCRVKLKNLREEILAATEDVPKLCHAIEKSLALPDKNRKCPLGYFLTPKEFKKWVADDVSILLNDEETKVSIEYLDSSGIIVNLGSEICPRPVWLCRNVIGSLLAGPRFLFGIPSKIVSLEDIKLALRQFEGYLEKRGIPPSRTATAEEAISVLCYLDLCIPVENSPGMFQIPALFQDSIRHGAWVEDATFDVYRGQRYECSSSVDIISPTSFVVFQSRCSRMTNTSCEAWKDGIKLVKIIGGKVVESRIEFGIKMEHHCIDIILRWSSKTACHEVAKEFLAEIIEMIAQVCDKRSPGVILNWFYLDSSYLRRHDEDPAIYSCSEVDRLNDIDHIVSSTRTRKKHSSRVRDLVIVEESLFKPMVASADPVATTRNYDSFPSDDVFAPDDLLRTCAAVKGSKWEEIGVFLISIDDLEDIGDSSRSHVTRMFRVLRSWRERAQSPTVGKLLKWFEEVGVNRRVIKMKFDELYGHY